MSSLIIDFVYLLYIVVILPYYLVRFITTPSSRLGLGERFGFIPEHKKSNKPAIWLHGSSVGELKSAGILIEKIRRTYPDFVIILSSLTPTAQLFIRKKYPDIHCVFFPIDLSLIVRRVLKRLKPKLIILLEQEIWPQFIRIARRQDIPVLLVNGRLTERSFNYYRFWGWVFKPTLKKINRLAVQNETYRKWYEELGVPAERITVTGNMKYDTVQVRNAECGMRNLLGIKSDDVILVGGSTSKPEETVLLEVYKNLQSHRPDGQAGISNLKLILAPRHPERFGEVEQLIKSKGWGCVKRSNHPAPLTLPASAGERVILLDTIGELASVYQVATVAFVGGSLAKRGGQNILEPAILGKPVIFGPYIYNFQDSADLLIKAGSGFMVHNKEDLLTCLKNLLSDLPRLAEIGKRGAEAISREQGATDRNMEVIKRFIPTPHVGV